jgi:hypothetical protein
MGGRATWALRSAANENIEQMVNTFRIFAFPYLNYFLLFFPEMFWKNTQSNLYCKVCFVKRDNEKIYTEKGILSGKYGYQRFSTPEKFRF